MKTENELRKEDAYLADLRWLLLVFSLPTKRATVRVEVWRKLKRIGALPLGPPGYLLPDSAANREHFEWLAATIRGHRGQASVIQTGAIDNLSHADLVRKFSDARVSDYQQFIQDVEQLQRRKVKIEPRLPKLRRRFQEIAAIDFFDCPLRVRAEKFLLSAARPVPVGKGLKTAMRHSKFRNRIWVTRPRPGIDRVACAWLIRKFIDPRAKFVFSEHAAKFSNAVPFDMFEGFGFTHRDNRCSFETLCQEFALDDPKVGTIAEIVHDADLRDQKFERSEGAAFEAILAGWAAETISDDVLLERGMQLFEGLYQGL